MLIPTLYSRFLLKRMATTSTKKVVFLQVCDNLIGISVADKLPADTSSGREIYRGNSCGYIFRDVDKNLRNLGSTFPMSPLVEELTKHI